MGSTLRPAASGRDAAARAFLETVTAAARVPVAFKKERRSIWFSLQVRDGDGGAELAVLL